MRAAICNLLGCTDQLYFEAVIVLYEIFELGTCPYSGLDRDRGTDILYKICESFKRFLIRFALGLLQYAHGLGFSTSSYDEAIYGTVDMAFSSVLLSSLFHVTDLCLKSFKVFAVHEIVIRNSCRILTRIDRVSTLKYLRLRSASSENWFRFQRIVVRFVGLSFEDEEIFSPHTFQACYEFSTLVVALALVNHTRSMEVNSFLNHPETTFTAILSLLYLSILGDLLCSHCWAPRSG